MPVTKADLETIVTDVPLQRPPAPPVLSPPKLIEQALQSGAGIEVIERLLALQERWEAAQAKKAFNTAIAAFKKDPPEILKTEWVEFETKRGSKTGYWHEDLAKALAIIDPALAAHGLWVRFKIANTPQLITVTCVVGHEDGYSEEAASLSAAPDTSGNKNAIQAIGSATAYLQRYTLKPALGMAAAHDDDGKGAGPPVVVNTLKPEQAAELEEILKANPKIDLDQFLKLAGSLTVKDILAVKFDSAKQYLTRKAEALKAKEAGK